MTSCIKCGDPAHVLMTFDYATRRVWLRDLGLAFNRYAELPLCEMHAERVVVPLGWSLDDERALEPPLFLAAGVA